MLSGMGTFAWRCGQRGSSAAGGGGLGSWLAVSCCPSCQLSGCELRPEPLPLPSPRPRLGWCNPTPSHPAPELAPTPHHTPPRSAPEVLSGKRCTEKVDLYSYGVVIWEVCTGGCWVRRAACGAWVAACGAWVAAWACEGAAGQRRPRKRADAGRGCQPPVASCSPAWLLPGGALQLSNQAHHPCPPGDVPVRGEMRPLVAPHDCPQEVRPGAAVSQPHVGLEPKSPNSAACGDGVQPALRHVGMRTACTQRQRQGAAHRPSRPHGPNVPSVAPAAGGGPTCKRALLAAPCCPAPGGRPVQPLHLGAARGAAHRRRAAHRARAAAVAPSLSAPPSAAAAAAVRPPGPQHTVGAARLAATA